MPLNTFKHTKISGISFVIPKKEIRIEDEIQYFNNSLKKVERAKKMIGLGSRRVADEGVTAADLCQQAAENLFDGMKIERNSIETLIFISQGPDHAIPATACILQDKLKLSKNIAAFDVNQGCTAYTYGLWLASSMIDSGACKRVLLLVGEAGGAKSDPDNRIMTPLFGDSGSATLLEYSEKEILSYFSLGTDGSGAEALMIPAGHARFPVPADSEEFAKYISPVHDHAGNPWYLTATYMDGGAIFAFTINVVPNHLKELMTYADHRPEDIDWLVLHQANKQILQNIGAKAGFPTEKIPTESFSKYGNQSGNSTAGVICDQLLEIITKNKAKILLSGYGVGLSWASSIINLENIWCSGMKEFETPKNLPTPQELEKYWLEKFKNNLKPGE